MLHDNAVNIFFAITSLLRHDCSVSDSWVYAYNRARLYGRIRIENLRWPNMPSELFTGIDAVSDVPPGGQFSDNFLYIFKGDHYYMMNRQTKFFSVDSYDVKGEIYTGCA